MVLGVKVTAGLQEWAKKHNDAAMPSIVIYLSEPWNCAHHKLQSSRPITQLTSE